MEACENCDPLAWLGPSFLLGLGELMDPVMLGRSKDLGGGDGQLGSGFGRGAFFFRGDGALDFDHVTRLQVGIKVAALDGTLLQLHGGVFSAPAEDRTGKALTLPFV